MLNSWGCKAFFPGDFVALPRVLVLMECHLAVGVQYIIWNMLVEREEFLGTVPWVVLNCPYSYPVK